MTQSKIGQQIKHNDIHPHPVHLNNGDAFEK
jgi:hypothetical protein